MLAKGFVQQAEASVYAPIFSPCFTVAVICISPQSTSLPLLLPASISEERENTNCPRLLRDKKGQNVKSTHCENFTLALVQETSWEPAEEAAASAALGHGACSRNRECSSTASLLGSSHNASRKLAPRSVKSCLKDKIPVTNPVWHQDCVFKLKILLPS